MNHGHSWNCLRTQTENSQKRKESSVMKKNLSFASKVSAILIVAAIVAASATWAGEVVIKRGALDLKRPAKSQFATPKSAPAMACVSCKPEFVPTQTQDTKLKTRT